MWDHRVVMECGLRMGALRTAVEETLHALDSRLAWEVRARYFHRQDQETWRHEWIRFSTC